ncbi:MAG TPA: chemotaxis response regulator protein-glutamate methylesterase [Verrucomicrobiae bacterium]|nr:chemotaxis response regulator protein-glutamate methylesterase [Verrucomicrobiae bacterium]
MRIAIVNDALLAAEALRRVITRAGVHEIAWIAQNGEEAVARCQRDRPDLILMDLFMPRMDGVEATRQIMATKPCAIIVATGQVEDHTGKVFEAMGAGALDAVSVPVMTTDSGNLDGAKEVLAKIETINRLVGSPKKKKASPPPATPVRAPSSARVNLVAIGSSAGGPTALTTLLAALPADFPAAIVIVQHVDKQFTEGLTTWFATHTKLQVRVAQEGDSLQPGVVYLAGRDGHLILSSPSQLGYVAQPSDSSYCPSVDVFFKSLARNWSGRAIGVLLTGMGRDGAEGLKALREAGHYTIAQDKRTSAVYGMPKAAAELDAAREILALDKIAPRLTNILLRQTWPTNAPT